MENTSVRAIVISQDQLLVMKRHKNGDDYFTLIGGRIDPGETKEKALKREVKEETGLSINNYQLVFIEEPTEKFGTQYIYLCEIENHDLPKLHPEAIERVLNDRMASNNFEPMWVKLDQLQALPFRSQTLKEHILAALRSGFPMQTVTINTREDIRYNN